MGEVSVTNPLSNTELLDTLPTAAFGELLTSKLSPQFQISYEYTVTNTDITTTAIANGGTVTQADALAVCNTSTTTASSALIRSKRHAKYKAGLGGEARFTALFTAPVADTEQLIGLADEAGSSVAFKNGIMVGYITTTEIGFHRFANDIVESIPMSQWDDPLDGSGPSKMTFDETKLNVFAVPYQYLGAGAIRILIENDSGFFIEVHRIPYANSDIIPSSYNPNYHITMHVDNLATTANLTMKSGSMGYFVQGDTKFIELHQPQFSSGKKEKTSVTTEVALATIRNKATYASKTNFIDIFLELFTASIEASAANNLGEVRLVRDATLGGVASYSDINATNSVVEIDTDQTTVAGGTEVATIPLAGKNDRTFIDLTSFEIILAPGETMTIAGSSVNSATVNGSLLWKELF